MSSPTILVSTWSEGVFSLTGATPDQALARHPVRVLASDGHGGTLAIVDECELRRRGEDGSWTELVLEAAGLSCCVALGEAIFVGTDDARVIRSDVDGQLTRLLGLNTIVGREKWYAGQALVDGRMLGPPLGIRSITATADGTTLLANVHVGGIPRSTDGGATWHPTIDIEADVHEVRAHPERPKLVVAAAAVGLCVSRDGGATWSVEHEGLHAPHCSAVAFAGGDILVSASEDPFTPRGAIYRRPIDGRGPLVAVRSGLPEWLDGKADTHCMCTRGQAVAIVDMGGNVYFSADAGGHWSRVASGLPSPSSVRIL